MTNFSVECVHQKFGGPLVEGWNEILPLSKAAKFGVIFQIFLLNLI